MAHGPCHGVVVQTQLCLVFILITVRFKAIQDPTIIKAGNRFSDPPTCTLREPSLKFNRSASHRSSVSRKDSGRMVTAAALEREAIVGVCRGAACAAAGRGR